MTIAIRALFALWPLLAVATPTLAAPHEVHDLQRDVAVLRAEQQQAGEKLALQQKLELATALDDLNGKVDRLTVRLDEADKRIGDLSFSLSLSGAVLTLLALIAGFVTYIHGGRQAGKTAKEWMDEHGRGEVEKRVQPIVAAQQAALDRTEVEIKALRDRANAELDELKKQALQPVRNAGVARTTAAATGPSIAAPPSGAAATFTNYDDARAATIAAFDAGRLDEALVAAEQALKWAHTPLQKLQGRRSRGVVLFPRDLTAALSDFEQTALEFPADLRADADLTVEIAKAHLGKAQTLSALNREREAIPVLVAAVARLPVVKDGALGQVLADTLNSLAHTYYQTDRPQEALDIAQQLLKQFGGNPAIEFKRACAAAELTSALALGKIRNAKAERDAYKALWEKYQGEADGKIKILVSYARYNAGVAHEKLGDLDSAREIYRLIDEQYAGESLPELVRVVNDARQRLRVVEATKSPDQPGTSVT